MARLKRRVKQDYETEENLTPLIDCIFLLLIFLMCVTEITKTENDQLLILPFAQSATKDEKPDERIVINVYPYDFPVGKIRKNAAMDAWVTINGEAMSWGDLQNYLEMIARTAEKSEGGPGGRDLVEMPVKIRGHRTTPFMNVQFAMVYCIDMAYWRISFGTYNEKDFKLPAPHFKEGADQSGIYLPPVVKSRVLN